VHFCPGYQAVTHGDHEETCNSLTANVFKGWPFDFADREDEPCQQKTGYGLPDGDEKEGWEMRYGNAKRQVSRAPDQTDGSQGDVRDE
jgi:hypothetical protein